MTTRRQFLRLAGPALAMPAHSGERSNPPIGGISLRIGRNTGSQRLSSTDCMGE